MDTVIKENVSARMDIPAPAAILKLVLIPVLTMGNASKANACVK
jgi:hypothetical protein